MLLMSSSRLEGFEWEGYESRWETEEPPRVRSSTARQAGALSSGKMAWHVAYGVVIAKFSDTRRRGRLGVVLDSRMGWMHAGAIKMR
jgi:hypothetical protein